MIEVKELRKAFGEHVAVDGVSFEIGQGEVFGLLGPNGAGKTTTIRMLVGLAKPDSGSIQIDGHSDSASARVQRMIGLAPQSISLYDDLTAEENLRFFGGMHRLAKRRLNERVAWSLEVVELTDRRRDFVKTFSGGMKRRLNLAAALVHEPKMLLLDEPTVGVDPQSRNHIFDSIKTLNADGLAVLYTTHYMEEAERLCDRVAIVDHGRLLALDCVDGLIANHGGPAKVRVEFNKAPSGGEPLPAVLDGRQIEFESAEPLVVINRLAGVGGGFAKMEISRPNLEDVFLKLTGHSLRD
ncbi:MAG: ABC transporter ATP-binding protein [Verrucomicrobia bacterium]|nr:ABC transporter ATP-binding protein [Verrucomicrobiota bacterium]